MSLQIAVLVGSLRRNSHNANFAQALGRLAAPNMRFNVVDIGSLPHYNDDLWEAPPPAVTQLKRDIETSDGVLFVTPEYNRAMPGVLKNAIDWGSRPWGKNSWAGKVAGVVGTSPGAIGSAVAQSQLRSILPGLEVVVLGSPEVYLHALPGLLDSDMNVTDDATKAFLTSYLEKFARFIADHRTDARASVAA